MNYKKFQTEIGKIFSILLILFSAFSFSQSSTCKSYTLTIGGWGNENPGNPNYQLLENNFSTAFPGGLTIGCASGFQVTFTSAQAIRTYLTSPGTSGPLTYSTTNPAPGSISNTLFNQLIGVKLAVQFDAMIPSYSNAATLLGDQIFVSGPFAGMTVNAFLSLADNFMGGCGTSSYTASQFNDAATSINENYDAGQDLGHLKCCNLTVSINPASITCFGAGTTLHANISGASSSAQISWYKDNVLIPGANSADLAVISGNSTYKIVVIDGNCNESDTEFVEEPAKITFNVKPFDNACFGETRQVELLNISGGTLLNGDNYTVTWTNTATAQVFTGNPVNLPQDSYTVVVSDSNQCTSDVVAVNVVENPQITVTFSGSILCFGGSTTLTATASGGSGVFTNYIWKKGNAVIQSGPSNTLANATEGTYSVEVFDSIGCSSGVLNHTLGQPTEIMITVNPIETACWQGTSSVSLNISGGTVNSASDYVINWFQWDGTDYSTTVFATGNPVNLPKGKYKVVVSDLNGCNKTVMDINVNEYPKVEVAISGEILCHGGTAALTSTASGGTGTYVTYQWWNGTTDLNNNSATLANAGPGTYTVKVWDSHNCTNPDVASITLVDPSAISITVTAPVVACYNGTSHVTVAVSGGTPWNDGIHEPYSISWYQGTQLLGTGSSIDLPVGSYTVTVTDKNNCPASANFNVTPVTCQGTTVTLGGWGAPANGNNWGTYRDTHFASVFVYPDYLKIGDGNRTVTLKSAAAVKNFLGTGGSPKLLPVGNNVNPVGYKNTLANNVVALTLNVKFDAANPNFGQSNTPLGSMIVVSGPMAGSTVNQVLALANQVLGGSSTQFTPSAMNAIVDAINNNFDNGTVNNNYLACPCGSQYGDYTSRPATTQPEVKPVTVEEVIYSVYPNPTRGEFNLKFKSDKNEAFTVQLYNTSGKMMADFSRNVVRNGNEITVSYTNYDLFEGLYILTVKSASIQKSFKVIVRK